MRPSGCPPPSAPGGGALSQDSGDSHAPRQHPSQLLRKESKSEFFPQLQKRLSSVLQLLAKKVVIFCPTDVGGLQEPQRHSGLLLPFLQQQHSSPIGTVLGLLLLQLHEG